MILCNLKIRVIRVIRGHPIYKIRVIREPMNLTDKIYIAGHTGLVGSALLKKLQEKGYSNFIFTPYPEYDLTNQQIAKTFFEKEAP